MSITQTPSFVDTVVWFTFGLQCTQASAPLRSSRRPNWSHKAKGKLNLYLSLI